MGFWKKKRETINIAPDHICGKYGSKRGMKKFTVQTYQYDDGKDMVLIEGEAPALEFLGNVLIA